MDKFWHKAKAFIGLEDEIPEEEIGSMIQREKTEDVARETEGSFLRFRTARKPNPSAELEIVVFEPKVYEDSLNISYRLRNGSPVIVNLKYLDPEDGTRLIDFICGAAYAIDGHMMRIGDAIFLFSPNNIAISGFEGKSQIEPDVETGEREKFFRKP